MPPLVLHLNFGDFNLELEPAASVCGRVAAPALELPAPRFVEPHSGALARLLESDKQAHRVVALRMPLPTRA